MRDSTLAYQGYGHGQPLEPLRRLIDYATGGLTPDLTIYLDLDVRRRAGAASGPAQPASGTGWRRRHWHITRRCAQGYLAMAARIRQRWLVVDAAADAVQTVIHAGMDRVAARVTACARSDVAGTVACGRFIESDKGETPMKLIMAIINSDDTRNVLDRLGAAWLFGHGDQHHGRVSCAWATPRSFAAWTT